MRNIKHKRRVKNKKGDFQFPFAWIFAIIAGMFILFLAIYGVVKFVNLQKTQIGAETAMGIGVLTNPMESSFETERRDIMDTHSRTRIYTECDNNSIFGKQIVRTSENTYQKWGEDLINVGFENKYFFAKSPVEGKYFYLFSKPFEFPFKVADLVYITSSEDKYCFVRPPDDIEDQIKNLIGNNDEDSENKNEYENFFVGEWSDCPADSIKICFDNRRSNCDTYVLIPFKSVRQRGQKAVYFEGDALMYAAIFSSPEDYECQLDRLMKRTEQLFEIYSDKAKFINRQAIGCNSDLDLELMQMRTLIKGFENSEKDLSAIYMLAKLMGDKNEYADCKLW